MAVRVCVCVCTHTWLCCRVELETSDPRWVGCWWLGFLIGAVFVLIITVPVSAFSRDLTGTCGCVWVCVRVRVGMRVHVCVRECLWVCVWVCV